MSFEQHIQQWVELDNQLRIVNDTAKKLRQERNNTENTIIKHIETNNLTNATIAISDGKLSFAAVKHTPTLSLKYVEECLVKCVPNKEQIEIIMNCIKNSREIKYTPDIKRSYTNKNFKKSAS